MKKISSITFLFTFLFLGTALAIKMPDGMHECVENNYYWDQLTNKCYEDKSGLPCVDPDGGKNYYDQAHTFGWHSWLQDGMNDHIRVGGRDACIGDVLREHYCSDNDILHEDVPCPYGCKDGACLESGQSATTGAPVIKRVWVTRHAISGCDYDTHLNATYSCNPQFRIWVDVRKADNSRFLPDEEVDVRIKRIADKRLEYGEGSRIAQYWYNDIRAIPLHAMSMSLLPDSLPMDETYRIDVSFNGESTQEFFDLTFSESTDYTADVRPFENMEPYSAHWPGVNISPRATKVYCCQLSNSGYTCGPISKKECELANRTAFDSEEEFREFWNNQRKQNVESNVECRDSDEGEDYYRMGYVQLVGDSTYGKKYDRCSGNTLTEYSCASKTNPHSTSYICPNGCRNGVCLEEEKVESDEAEDINHTSQNSQTENEESSTKIPPAGYEDEVLVQYDVYDNPFPDTNLRRREGKAAAELYRRAVIGGFPDGEFKGDRDVNRAEAAKFLLLSRYGSVDDVSNNGRFPDVIDDQWYTKFVVTAADKGIIGGHPDGTFRPADTVNTAEFLKMLSLTFELQLKLSHSYTDVSPQDWFAPYAGIAQKYDLFPGRSAYLQPGDPLTREEVAVAIYQYLQNR